MIAHSLQIVPVQMTLIGPSNPVAHTPKGVTLGEIQAATASYTVTVSNRANTYSEAALKAAGKEDAWSTWAAAIQIGIMNYATGKTTVEKFVAEHKIPMKPWMKLAYQWADLHPDSILCVGNDRFDWLVYKRGVYTCFDLPHHDRGGEKSFVSNDGVYRVLIAED